MDWGLRCGRLFGIEIKIHWSFFIFMAMELLRSHDPKITALYLTILFVTILIHEFGHCFGARHFGLSADRILLWPLGGLASVGSGRNTRESFWISFAGPFVHIPIALLAGAWLAFQGGSFSLQFNLLDPLVVTGFNLSLGNLIVNLIFTVQVWLFALNVFLPAFPLDGGQMFVATMLPRWGALKTSKAAMILSVVCACYLLSLNVGFIGMFLLMEAAQLYQYRQTGLIYSHPSFSQRAPVNYGQRAKSVKGSRSREVSHLRLVVGNSRQCPQCGRTLPEAAKMCGYCEIPV